MRCFPSQRCDDGDNDDGGHDNGDHYDDGDAYLIMTMMMVM